MGRHIKEVLTLKKSFQKSTYEARKLFLVFFYFFFQIKIYSCRESLINFIHEFLTTKKNIKSCDWVLEGITSIDSVGFFCVIFLHKSIHPKALRLNFYYELFLMFPHYEVFLLYNRVRREKERLQQKKAALNKYMYRFV